MTKLHSYDINNNWQNLSLLEQLANIGSEVGRSISSRNKTMARDRALELFELTLADKRWFGPRRREIATAKESYLQAFNKNDTQDLNIINKYFYNFALLTRLNK